MYMFLFKCVHVCVEVWSLRHGFTVQVRGQPQAWSSPFTFLEAKSLVILLLSMPGWPAHRLPGILLSLAPASSRATGITCAR